MAQRGARRVEVVRSEEATTIATVHDGDLHTIVVPLTLCSADDAVLLSDAMTEISNAN